MCHCFHAIERKKRIVSRTFSPPRCPVSTLNHIPLSKAVDRRQVRARKSFGAAERLVPPPPSSSLMKRVPVETDDTLGKISSTGSNKILFPKKSIEGKHSLQCLVPPKSPKRHPPRRHPQTPSLPQSARGRVTPSLWTLAYWIQTMLLRTNPAILFWPTFPPFCMSWKSVESSLSRFCPRPRRVKATTKEQVYESKCCQMLPSQPQPGSHHY